MGGGVVKVGRVGDHGKGGEERYENAEGGVGGGAEKKLMEELAALKGARLVSPHSSRVYVSVSVSVCVCVLCVSVLFWICAAVCGVVVCACACACM